MFQNYPHLPAKSININQNCKHCVSERMSVVSIFLLAKAAEHGRWLWDSMKKRESGVPETESSPLACSFLSPLKLPLGRLGSFSRSVSQILILKNFC